MSHVMGVLQPGDTGAVLLRRAGEQAKKVTMRMVATWSLKGIPYHDYFGANVVAVQQPHLKFTWGPNA